MPDQTKWYSSVQQYGTVQYFCYKIRLLALCYFIGPTVVKRAKNYKWGDQKQNKTKKKKKKEK